MVRSSRVRVLVVDDSRFIRESLTEALEQIPNIEVVASAKDVYEARDYIVRLRPQVMTLDVEMPKMDGVTFVKRLMPQWPMPIIMVSSESYENSQITLNALDAGALDFVAKPSSVRGEGFQHMVSELGEKILAVAQVDRSHWQQAQEQRVQDVKKEQTKLFRRQTQDKKISRPELIAIGASTGGPQAMHEIVQELPPSMPPIVLAQHMPAGFTKLFAERLDNLSQLNVSEASDGQELKPGMMVIAPGGYHLQVRRQPSGYAAKIYKGPNVNGHTPSCDPLFRSCVPFADQCLGVMLTGMGMDGATALKSLHSAGAFTIGQDKASSVVYGMPQAAKEYGAISLQLPLTRVAPFMVRLCHDQGHAHE